MTFPPFPQVVKIPALPDIELLSIEGAAFIEYAKQQLKLVTAKRERLVLGTLHNPPIFVGKVRIDITSSILGDKIRIGGKGSIGGFLFHPRSGEIIKRNTETQPPMQYSVVDGTGWNFDGEPLPGSASIYPLADSDHGTRRIWRNHTTRDWKYKPRTPENYGNVDWKGKNTAKAGSASNAIVLTWHGSVSRYFPQIQMFRYLSSSIYHKGEVIATLPLALDEDGNLAVTPMFGENIPYVCLGAAVTKDRDSKQWLVVVARQFAPTGLFSEATTPAVFCKPFSSRDDHYYDEVDHPKGWRQIWTDGDGDVNIAYSVNYFFNESGNQAVAIESYIEYDVYIDINSKRVRATRSDTTLEGTRTITAQYLAVNSVQNWNVYYPGQPPVTPYPCQISDQQNLAFAEERVKGTIAADFIGDTKHYATIRSEMDVDGGQFTWSSTGVQFLTDVPVGFDPMPPETPYAIWDYTEHDYGDRGRRRATTTLSMRGSSTKLWDYSYLYESHMRQHAMSCAGFGIYDPGRHWIDTTIDRTINFTLKVVLFIDLRNDILVTGELVDAFLTRYGARETWEGGVYKSTPIAVNNFGIDYNMRINGFKIGSGFDQYLGQSAASLWVPEYYEDEYFADFFMTNESSTEDWARLAYWQASHPLGSWAVDADGNEFFSQMTGDGVYNHLTGGDPVSLSETRGQNPVFYPIAPV